VIAGRPALDSGGASRRMKTLLPVLKAIVPRVRLNPGPRRDRHRARSGALDDYLSDPMMQIGRITPALAAATLEGIELVMRRADDLQVPMMLMHGLADRVVPADGTIALHAMAGAADKTLRTYDGAYHHLLLDDVRDAVTRDMVAWLDAHLYAFESSCAFPVCPGNPVVEAVEFRRSDRDRFIFVTDPAEREALDDGRIAGWDRTGETMRVWVQGARTAGNGFHPVYRFWGGSVTYEPSHFFTADRYECAVLRDRLEWNWTFERSGFWAWEWNPEGCPWSGVPLYRTYNNGLDGAPAHRYSTKRSVIDEMIARGWVDEGPVMCIAGS
jgi:hypothetical protein